MTGVRIEDVARAAGLSTATVSRYINGARVQAVNAQRIQAAIEHLHYVPNLAARTLAGSRTHTIGLVLYALSSNFFSTLLRGIETRTNEGNYALLVHATRQSKEHQRPTQLVLGEHNTDGLLVFADSLSEYELQEYRQRNFPLVLMYQKSPSGLIIPSVQVENTSGIIQLVRHLHLQHGRERIAFLAGPQGHPDAMEREQGFMRALLELGIVPDTDIMVSGEFSAEGGYRAVRQMLQQGLYFDAICAADDDSAAGAMRALWEAGIGIPDEVAVVGFDDIAMAETLTPPLTTVHSPIEQVGYEAVGLLLDCIAGKETVTDVILPTHSVFRQSCGCKG